MGCLGKGGPFRKQMASLVGTESVRSIYQRSTWVQAGRVKYVSLDPVHKEASAILSLDTCVECRMC